MKTIYLMIAMMCISLNSHSQEVKDSVELDIPCYDTQELFKTLKEKYKELPFMMGIAGDAVKSTVSVWMNPVENNWSIIATKNDLSCVIGTGEGMKLVPYKKGTSI